MYKKPGKQAGDDSIRGPGQALHARAFGTTCRDSLQKNHAEPAFWAISAILRRRMAMHTHRISWRAPLIAALLTLGLGLPCQQGRAQAPKRELRAAWIATVANIDWPSKPGLPAQVQQAEYIQLLDKLQSLGMNAVIVQVRPCADALFASTLEPWSYWLTGQQGALPDPYYDPLAFMIKEAHRRGMEFHAWFNPYRAVFNIRKPNLSADHITRRRPAWFLTYGDKKYFNPGLPEVWNYLVLVVTDVVRRYDIDAVQFDDYFYPYRIAGKPFPDGAAYSRYGRGMSLGDWRRHNVDTVIQMLSTAIKAEKPWVQFGISPFGVWRNASVDPAGSATRAGQTNYDDLYADILLWLRKGWIDYVCPQLYWEFGHSAAPYGVLLDWWSHHTYGRRLYIGQAPYRIGSNSAWRDPAQLPRQIRANRLNGRVQGSIYFSARSFDKPLLGFDDSLRLNLYRYPAIPPTMPWIDSIPPAAPRITGSSRVDGGLLLQWKDGDSDRQTTQFAIYRFDGDQAGDFNDASHILAVVARQRPEDTAALQSFIDRSYVPGQHYLYVITALDRLHNESLPSPGWPVPSPPSARAGIGAPAVAAEP